MNEELMQAIQILEKEKDISREALFEAIETSLLIAAKNHFGTSDNMRVEIDPESCEYHLYMAKTVVKDGEVSDATTEIEKSAAKEIDDTVKLGDTVEVEFQSKEFGRIATQSAKNTMLQKMREEERAVVYDMFSGKERDVVTGIVQRQVSNRGYSINLGKADALLAETEQVKGEHLRTTERIKVYILEVKKTNRGPRILVSRTHPDLVRRLFEAEVSEIQDGTVEIKSISREPGSRSKIAVWSNNPDVDPVGACVGVNGSRVNAVVDELKGEKIDIVCWDENPAILIENALSPAKVISVIADGDEKSAKVVVPDYQLSLAIGKEGQNARLAAKLTGFGIDIKSETQAKDAPGFRMEDYYNDEDEYEDEAEYEEDAEGEYVEENADTVEDSEE